ncbi:unnamed protein product [Allacma fusca]|uniref:Uncharacterized protein n=1 Tax=Allacma fusca TaxID=39272 RepID=A0A8J2K1B8_9HEXA|nr:unnamed protein product [Allacma fusca]
MLISKRVATSHGLDVMSAFCGFNSHSSPLTEHIIRREEQDEELLTGRGGLYCIHKAEMSFGTWESVHALVGKCPRKVFSRTVTSISVHTQMLYVDGDLTTWKGPFRGCVT